MERLQGWVLPIHVAMGTVVSPLRLLLLSPVWSVSKSTTCSSGYGILWGHDKRKVWCRTQDSGQSAEGSETRERHPGFIKQALSHPASPSAIVIRLGVAMVTGEVT